MPRKQKTPSVPFTTAAARVEKLLTQLYLVEGQLALLARIGQDGELSTLGRAECIVDAATQVLGEMYEELQWLSESEALKTIDAPDIDEREAAEREQLAGAAK